MHRFRLLVVVAAVLAVPGLAAAPASPARTGPGPAWPPPVPPAE